MHSFSLDETRRAQLQCASGVTNVVLVGGALCEIHVHSVIGRTAAVLTVACVQRHFCFWLFSCQIYESRKVTEPYTGGDHCDSKFALYTVSVPVIESDCLDFIPIGRHTIIRINRWIAAVRLLKRTTHAI